MIWWMAWIGWSFAAPHECGEWVRTPVTEVSGAIRDPILSVSKNGRVHGMWFAPETGQSHYGLLTARGWQIEPLGPGRGDMVVEDGVPYVVQMDCGANDCGITYGWREEKSWKRSEVLRMRGPITTPSLAIGPDGLPHVVYAATVGNSSMIMHASPTYGAWHTQKVTSGTVRLGSPDLAVDKDGNLQMIYTRAELGGRVLWNHHKNKRWTESNTEIGRGREVRILVGDIGANYAAYFLDGQRIAIQTPANGWVNYGEPLAGSGSAAVGPGGAPQFMLVVDERPLKRLEWAWWTGTGWERELVAADPMGFRAASMALDSMGCPHVLYQHSGSPKTVYARAKL